MKFFSLIASAALATATFLGPVAVQAHSKMASSTPAEGATIAKPRVLTLNFTEALLPPTAAASIVMTAMPGVKNHGEMVIRNFTSSWSNNNKTLTLKLREPLRTGSYEVRWQAAGADGHRMTGKVSFKVS
ncbi:copper homeostasis periplasmic binding protein CopC [Sphingorhabdus sp.]|uniref:copper homeostasis periplasmic binding protein CopC n=1 Tax=Sphingorhabdus sp. TaxID=1902408 RepID=UPI00391D1090